MAPKALIVTAVLLFSAASLDGTPLGDMMSNRLTTDRDNYKDMAMAQNGSHVLLAMVAQQKVESELLKHAPLDSKEDATTLSPTKNVTEVTSAPPGRPRRSPFYPFPPSWLPFWLRRPVLVPVPQNNHFVYDNFLGKVRREAPIPPDSTITISSQLKGSK